MSDAKLNIQGLSRRDKGEAGMPGLCSYIVANPGNTFVSMDLGAGEPTVTAHYSKDVMYRYATLDGVGKVPHWTDEGLLKIDDIYLMFMSSTTIGKSILDKAWAATWDDGMTFAEQWMTKPKVIKTHLDEHRQFFKMLALALIYGMAPARMVKQCYEQFSYHMTLDEAQSIYDGYWTTFSGVRGLVNRLAKHAKKGYMYNEFGYRLTFNNSGERGKDTCHKAANFIIQSTVSGIMHLFNHLLQRHCAAMGIPFLFVTVIHDETVLEVPVSQIEKFKEAKEWAVSALNDRLKWSVPISVGLAISDNFGGLK
jgi:hypothetical protein